MRVDNQNQTSSQPKMRKLNYDQDYLKQVPIREIAEILGINVDVKGKFECPCHFKYLGKIDEHASGSLDEARNRWNCFSCEGGGSTIDLVMETKGCNFNEAMKFLVKYYPEADKSEEKAVSYQRPFYQTDFYQSIGFNKNPYNVGAQMASYIDDTKAMKLTARERHRLGGAIYKKEQFPVEEWVVTGMVIDKIFEKQESIIEYGKQKQYEYGMNMVDKALEKNPELSTEECLEIFQKAKEECEEWKWSKQQFMRLGNIKDQFMEYYNELEETVATEDREIYLGDEEPEEDLEPAE